MKAREAIKIFERAKETGFCASLRGFAECVGVVPSTIVNWKNNPEKELRDIETIKVQYVKEEVEKFDPEFVDWSSFRREAAKDILVAMTRKVVDDPDQLDSFEPDFYARVAVEWADSLVYFLKRRSRND